METNDTSIICCFCGNRTQITSNIFNEFIEHLHICSLKRNHLLFILKFSMVRQMISVFRISIRNPASFIHN